MARSPNIEEEDWKPTTEAYTGRKSLALGLLALTVLMAFHVFQMKNWIAREGRPPAWDQATHLQISLECRQAVEARDFKRLLLFKPKPGMPPFPPLYHLSVAYAYSYPDPARAALWANCFYMALLCLSLWGLGKHFSGDWGGVAAAVLFSCAPETQWLYYNQLVDLALISWVAAAYWALIYSRNFSRRIPSLLFGLAAAAAFLTKWSAFSYFIPVIWLGWIALWDSDRRFNVVAAAVLLTLLCAPWYISQGAVLIPRLVDASADNAVAVWRGQAALMYLIQMIAGLETPLWFFGLLAILVASTNRRREGMGTLLLWIFSSYAFWAVVPNRQLRYLLPGLPPLVILSVALWPWQLLSVLTAYQLAVAVNYPVGWIGQKSLDLPVPTCFFRSDLPAKEDWKIEDILKTAERISDPTSPIANLSLVANLASFNGPTFNWVAADLRLRRVHIRGVNRRLCEFSEFVLVKTGSLGPRDVVGQLPEVQRFMMEKNNWFSRGYKDVGHWDLPDKTEAILFQRRTLTKAPVGEKKAHYNYFEEGSFAAENLDVDFGKWDGKRGVYPLVRVSAPEVMIRGLNVKKVRIEMEDLSLVPVQEGGKIIGAAAKNSLLDFRFLRMKRLRVASAEVSEFAAMEFLKFRVHAVSSAEFKINKTISASIMVHEIPIFAEVSAVLSPDRGRLNIELKRASVFALPIPAAAVGALRRYALDFSPNPELPFEVDVPGLSLADGRLSILKK